MISQELLDYIQGEINSGKSTDEVRAVLLEKGWQDSHVNDAFRQLGHIKDEETAMPQAPVAPSALQTPMSSSSVEDSQRRQNTNTTVHDLSSNVSKEKKSKWTKILLFGFLGIVILLLLIVVITSQFSGVSKHNVEFQQNADGERINTLNALNNAFTMHLLSIVDPVLSCGNIYSSDNGSGRVDGTGWIPIDFTKSPSGPPLSELPFDPMQDEGYAYEFACDPESFTFEFSATLMSDKYKDLMSTNDGGNNPEKYEVGTDLTLIP